MSRVSWSAVGSAVYAGLCLAWLLYQHGESILHVAAGGVHMPTVGTRGLGSAGVFSVWQVYEHFGVAVALSMVWTRVTALYLATVAFGLVPFAVGLCLSVFGAPALLHVLLRSAAGVRDGGLRVGKVLFSKKTE